MPVTPFHLGPAMVVKAACPRAFSLGVFAIVQVMIDIETALNMVTGRYPLHGGLHTILGATLAALAVAAPARAALAALSRVAAGALRPSGAGAERLFGEPGPVPWLSALTGALLGGASHSLLDALVHPDVEPLAPWIPGNALFIPGAFHGVHLACAVVFVAGGLAWYARSRERPAS